MGIFPLKINFINYFLFLTRYFNKCFNITGIWMFSCVGDTSGVDSSTERFQVHWHERVQRSDHVRVRSCRLCCNQRPTNLIIRNHRLFHNLLYDNNTLPSICTKGNLIHS